jgi:tRNA A37 threonylcarbamoyladenosine dehydratase
VGRLILIDNDTVSLTNINRQSIAFHSTVDKYKTLVMKEKIADINPELEVITHEAFILPDNLETLFTERVDYIIDAIDTVTTKIAIVELARKLEIPLISSMGTGNKLHPEMFEITDIYKTSVCPLCKVMRKELKARNVPGLKVLYSKEQPVDVSKNGADEEISSKRSVPGSVAFVPPVAGLIIAGEVIRELAGVN